MLERHYNNINMHMAHKEMLDVTMLLYDTKSHKILEIELCTVFLRSDVATILFIIDSRAVFILLGSRQIATN